MPFPSVIEIAKTDLFTNEDELRSRYPDVLVQRVCVFVTCICGVLPIPMLRTGSSSRHAWGVMGFHASPLTLTLRW